MAMAFINRIVNWTQKPILEKLNSFVYHYRSLKYKITTQIRKPEHLTAVFKWGKIKVNTDWLGLNIYLGSYEKKEMMMLQKMLTVGTIAYDIGANLGYYTIFLCKSINCKKVVSFEPSQREFGQLNANIEENFCNNAETFQMAIGDRDGVTDLFLAQENFGKNSVTDIQLGGKKIEVNIRMLDELEVVQEFPPAFIKIDVEGAEPLVLQGAKNTIKRHKPLIMYETWIFDSTPFNPEICKATGILNSYDYVFFDITNSIKLKPLKVGQKMTSTNIIAIHRENVSSFDKFICK